jgi:hypothetical protein
MKSSTFTLTLLLLSFISYSQPSANASAKDVSKLPDKGKELKEGWNKTLNLNLTFNQTTLTNWFAGGDRFSAGLASALKTSADYKKNKFLYKSNLEAAYGFISTTSTHGIRKNEDRWVYTTSLNRQASPKWYYTFAGQVRSQFTDGYNYLEDGTKVLGSAFLTPGDIKLGIGFTYQPNAEFSAYFSPLTAKINMKMDERFRNMKIFGVDSGKTTAFDLGAYSRIDYKKDIRKDLNYIGSLDVFYGYILHNYNFYLSNMLTWKLNKYFGATFGLDIAYDNTQPTPDYGRDPVTNKEIITGKSVKLQVKQVFGFGITYAY